MITALRDRSAFKRHYALPQDHGSWVFILSPLLIGLFAGQRWNLASIFLVLAAFAAFLIRQPVTIAIKAMSGRRARRDLSSALFWILIYALVGLFAVAGLVLLGFGYLLILALPGIPVFVWHLYLVSKRAERRQMLIEMIGTGVLALAAPAASWVGRGQPDPVGWWLFILTWIQSAASIMYAYLRLEQRTLPHLPPRLALIRMARPALLFTIFNFTLSCILSIFKIIPVLLPLPFAIQLIETFYGSLQPAIGYKPTRIGVRQLIVSTLFTITFIWAWLA